MNGYTRQRCVYPRLDYRRYHGRAGLAHVDGITIHKCSISFQPLAQDGCVTGAYSKFVNNLIRLFHPSVEEGLGYIAGYTTCLKPAA